jgi:hypothetical protein
MFIGSINRYMRCVLESAASQWRGQDIYVACSGNFTVERILSRCGVGRLFSNDVSIYSCALGWHLVGQAVPYKIKEQAGEFAWLADYLEPGPATIATLLLTGEMLKVSGDNPYARRMQGEYRRRWPELHAKTVERVTKATANLRIAEYFAGDCREFLAKAGRNAVCISFPPTYEGGYERLFKKLDAIFDWPRPAYQVFSPEDFDQFSQTVRSFRHWMISSDAEQPAFAARHVATVQTSLRSKPVFMYCDQAAPKLALAHQELARNPWAPLTEEVVEPVQVVRMDGKVLNAIRSVYLNPHIMPAMPQRCYAVLSAGKLVGAFGVSWGRGYLPCDVYLMCDFAVRPSPHKRLSKLILAALLSKAVQIDLEQATCSRVKVIGTTAFTDKPVSMKYRGLFEVHNRGEGYINYMGQAGRWSLQEGFQWWKANHSTK